MRTSLLLADDSVTIQRVIELTFADEDVHVIAVSDGNTAIARVEQEPPDIVLADAGMAGKNGYEVARYIKQSPHLAHIPVLLLTGAFDPVDLEKAGAAGCDGVLAKPFEPQLVIRRVKELLEGSRGRLMAAGPAGAAAPGNARKSPAPAAGGTEAPVSAESTDDFFDRLDAAFATRTGAHQDRPASSEHGGGLEERRLGPTLVPSDNGGPHAVPPPSPRLPRQPMPALADAFTALLTAEQWGGPPADAGTATTPAVTDDLVERVAARVLERLTDQVVRETVADLASAIAERLIREEIERIKAEIK
jgi:CheY-like chemotaxis protein